MKHNTYLLLIALLIFGISCTSSEDCTQDRIAKMGVGFYTRALTDTTKHVYTTTAKSLDTLSVRGLTANGTLIDSILYKSKSIQMIYLPLNKFENSSKFVLTFKTVKDTIEVLHTNTDYYLSLECGCMKVHSIDTVLTTTNLIESVKIINHKVNATNAEHIQIFVN
jgi:hypothetical protein